MDEIYGWLAARHNFSVESLRETARDWWRVAFVLMPIGAGILAFLLALGAQPTGDLLDGLRRQIPDWLPLAAYVTFWLGVVAAMYSCAVRRTAKKLSAYL